MDEKEKQWKLTMARLDAYGSNEGDDVVIDDEIKGGVAALNLLGYETTASCGGHPDEEGMALPMLQGILPNNRAKGKLAHKEVGALVDEFNANRRGPYLLALHPEVTWGFRIESIAEKEAERMMIEDEVGYDHDKMRTLKLGAQAEFRAFEEFLKGKYFQ